MHARPTHRTPPLRSAKVRGNWKSGVASLNQSKGWDGSVRGKIAKGHFVQGLQHPRIFGRGHIGRGWTNIAQPSIYTIYTGSKHLGLPDPVVLINRLKTWTPLFFFTKCSHYIRRMERKTPNPQTLDNPTRKSSFFLFFYSYFSQCKRWRLTWTLANSSWWKEGGIGAKYSWGGLERSFLSNLHLRMYIIPRFHSRFVSGSGLQKFHNRLLLTNFFNIFQIL